MINDGSKIEGRQRLASFRLTASPATLTVATLTAMLGAAPTAAQVLSPPAVDTAPAAEHASALEADSGLGEIVGTAQHVTEKLQDVAEGLTVDYKYDQINLTEMPRGPQANGFVPGAIAGTIAGILRFHVPGDVTASFKRLDAYSSAYQSASRAERG